LRFISGALEEDLAYPETKFYGILAEEVSNYLTSQSSQVPENLSLLRPEIERVTLHPVRFEIGYADNARRPKPALGTNLKNPLAASLQRGADYV
jgi:aerobactin synthase